MTLVTKHENETIGSVRTAIDSMGRPVFCLKDVCDILGIKNVSDSKKRLKDTGIVKIETTTAGGKQKQLFITESNLYKLIFQSRKMEAEKFVSWVTEDILPQIRRYGKYDVRKVLESNETALEFITSYEELQLKVSILEKLNIDYAEVKEYVNKSINSNCLVLLSNIAKEIGIEGITTKDIFSILREKEILDNENQVMQEYVDKKYFRVDTHSYITADGIKHINQLTYVYKSGINFIKKLLKKYVGGK